MEYKQFLPKTLKDKTLHLERARKFVFQSRMHYDLAIDGTVLVV